MRRTSDAYAGLVVVAAALALAPAVAAQEPRDQPGPVVDDPLADPGFAGLPALGPFDPFPPGVGLSLLAIGATALLLWPIERLLVGLFAHSRIVDPQAVLKHPTRQRLYDHLRDNPGCHYREVQRELGLSNATARWHLDKLEACGVVRSKRLPGKRVLYATGYEEGVRPVVLAALTKNANVRRILQHLLDGPGSTTAQLARALRLNPMTVRWHVNKLQRDGFVQESEGRHGVPLSVAEDDRALVMRLLAPPEMSVASPAPIPA